MIRVLSSRASALSVCNPADVAAYRRPLFHCTNQLGEHGGIDFGATSRTRFANSVPSLQRSSSLWKRWTGNAREYGSFTQAGELEGVVTIFEGDVVEYIVPLGDSKKNSEVEENRRQRRLGVVVSVPEIASSAFCEIGPLIQEEPGSNEWVEDEDEPQVCVPLSQVQVIEAWPSQRMDTDRVANPHGEHAHNTHRPFKRGRAEPNRLLVRQLSTCRVFIVAGEPSGDAIGSRLMASLRCLAPQPLEFAGVGGPLMEKAGLQSQFPMEDISIMGLVELIPHSIRLWRRLRETITAAIAFQPNIVITIDSKGFSFRVLRGITDAYAGNGQCRPLAVHYVAPSFWAWKGGEENLKRLSRIMDHMLCILPFEEDVCQTNGIGATFVGHPVLEDSADVTADGELHNALFRGMIGNAATFRAQHQVQPGSTLLSVLPGSRLQEVQRMLPIFRDAVTLLQKSIPDLTVVMPTAQCDTVTRVVGAVVANWRVPVILLPGASDTDKYNSFAASSAALCTSGTAVLQVHLAHLPCVVAYRAHPLTEYFIRRGTKLKFISLPNILLSSGVIPEALFGSCTAGQIAAYLRPLIEDEEMQKEQLRAAEKVMRLLAPPVNCDLPINNRFGSRSPETIIPPSKPSFVAAASILRLLEEKLSPLRTQN